MKINLLSNPLKACQVLCLLLVGLTWTMSLNAQCPGRSTTCRFAGTTATNDTIQPAIILGLNPGTCLATVNVPRPAYNVARCGSAADYTLGRTLGNLTLRNDVGCSFAEACNSSFGCGIITVTNVAAPVAPVGNSGAATSPYDVNCGPVQIVMFDNGTSNWSDTYNMLVSGCNVGTYTSGNNTNDTLRVPRGTYNNEVIATNGFVRVQPDHAWGGVTTFGECVPTFQVNVPNGCCESINNITNNCNTPTITSAGGRYYIRWTGDANDGAVVGIQQVIIQDTEPPTFVGCPKAVVINLGPGECEGSWDAPPIMAMDNCPAAIVQTGTEMISPACQAAYNIVWNPGFFGGNMWDIQNTSTRPLIFHGIDVAWRNMDTATVWYTTAPGSHVPVRFTASAWTRCNSGAWVAGGGGAFPAPARTYIDLRTRTLVARSSCTGTTVDTIRGGCPVIQPGETRGIYIAGIRGQGGMYWSNGGCTTTGNPWGDANLKILKNPTMSCVFGTGLFGVGGGLAITGNNQFVGNIRYSFPAANNMIEVVQTCGQPYGPGCFFPIGCTTLCYTATDAQGNVARCQFDVCVNEYANTVTALACHDEIQISLDENCSATISADEVLSGGPYRCYDDYTVEIRDWITNNIVDRQPNVPGAQVGVQDLGRELKITVRDPQTGNSCWGHATVEDKLPPSMVCARDTCVPCYSPTSPAYTGSPSVDENCSSYTLTYKDNVVFGSCAIGNDRVIRRTWTATDGSGNKSVCVQTITVSLGTLFDAEVPLNWDNIENPMLSCDGKINPSKDVTPHMLAYPYCVDGYLLDSAHWFATGGFLPSPAGDLAGERLPRTLGWNCIDAGEYAGHPSPYPIYYPAHPSWRPNNPVCWGPDQVVMWHGTGYPGGVNCKNLGVTWKDITIDLATPGCDAGDVGCFKIIRQWTVMDWCTSELGGVNQIIKVADAEGPKILYPDTVIVNMEVWTCTGRWEVPPAWLIDNCSNEIHYTVEVEAGTVLGNEVSGYVVVDMPMGIQNGYVVAEDCCGNITKKRIALNVQDNVPPVAVCEQKTVVSINGNQSPGENFAKIFAESFDQGSFDNCAPHIFFKVIRMEHLRGTNNGSNANQADNGTNCAGINGDDNAILDGNQIYFDDHVKFCCSDVGKTIMVVFRVFDRETGAGPIAPSRMNPGGNLFNRFSDCMVEVEVQDKSVPTVVAPPNIVVSCWFWFDVDNLDDPNDATFGRVVTDLSVRKKVVTKDLVCYNYCVRNDYTGYPGYVPGAPPSNPPAWNRACDYYRQLFDTAHADRKYELTWGFDGYVLSNCGNTPTISVNDNRECGQGQLTRTVVARGPNGISVTATQTIWVVDCDPFYINRADNCDPDDDITWPGNCTGQATTIDGCGADLSPDNPLLGRPVVENGADDLCALISIEYFDEVFTIEPDACFKVLRKWVVIDWCQYDPSIDPVNGRWEYLQIIKVHDSDKPVVSISVGDCEPAVKTNGVCYGHLTITADATDNCSPLDWLFYDYKIDAFNDGKGAHSGYDFIVGPLTRKEFAAGRTPLFHDNPFADNPNNPFEASGTYPVGVHKICFHVEDGCGNVGIACQLFEVKDCKAPTPYCLTGVITVPMPASGCVTVWAKDLDRGSFDNCTDADDLLFYFDGDPTKTSITICCSDFVAAGANDELVVDVQMWVEDQEGNTDYCKTVVIVQDNQDICPDGVQKGRITGDLVTEKGDETELANVQMYVGAQMMREVITKQDGHFMFGDLAFGATTEYMVRPLRNDNHVNGVSTADIVKIQRHILGIEYLNSPYKIIAADVNNSQNITASDVTEIRKLILGVSSEFAKVQSWTFVPKEYVFPNPSVPYNAPREVLIAMPNASTHDEDFVAVKMGDVTGNAVAHNVNGSSTRTNEKLNLEIESGNLVAGESYTVEFKSSNFSDIIGYQFTLNFDQTAMMFDKVGGGALELDETNFGLSRLEEGKITTSWNNRTGVSFGKDEVLFSITFTALKNGSIHELLAVTSDVTFAEAYNSKLEERGVELGIRTDDGIVGSGVFELYQNTPNPFDVETVVNFRLPKASPAKLSIYDVTGKVIRVYDLQGVKGMNSIRITKDDVDVSGVLYYQLDAADHTATKRMTKLK